jgi:beta-galactosidase
MKRIAIQLASLFLILSLSYTCNQSVTKPEEPVRERVLMDFDWQFAFGHPYDHARDFNHGTGYFSYLAKAGNGDGAASANFDDRTWRTIDLPHDWAVEVPFDARGSHSHGYKAIGRNFPENSVGWYRKTFTLPEEDVDKRFLLEFEGVTRDAKVWVNGFYCGNEPSGYYSFSFDISEYLNFGGKNVIAVRTDVTLEEGWFYEGAGIYRHVWLTKTNPLHIPQYGTWVTSEVNDNSADVTARVKVVNQEIDPESFYVLVSILNSKGKEVARTRSKEKKLNSFQEEEYTFDLNLLKPRLWSIDDPHLYTLVSTIVQNGQMVDEYKTPFGIRTIRFDPDEGFFLNGEHVKLLGTNNHQDHAGVGCAIPDALNEWRIKQLKKMGSNTYRTAHNPPTPELLDICDRLGMLVIDENRLMGTSEMHLDYLRRMIERDRNHPSVILWSIGNEEWAIEGSGRGADIAQTMQAFAKSVDPTRPINAAISGGWDNGIATVIEVMGYNYLHHGDTDKHHEKFPWQPSLGTEEGSTNTTRGIYFDDFEKQYLAAYDRKTSIFWSYHQSWQHYAERDYLAGVCYWTGFDYRGESTPFGWPSVASYFGIFDLCGFPKDNYHYLKSWWNSEPEIHILPHWNWTNRQAGRPGKAGEEIDVWVYSNCDEAELFLNGKSLGKKQMEENSSLAWKVNYEPGTVKAVGYTNGEKTIETSVSTSGETAKMNITADKQTITANRRDVAVVTIKAVDENGLPVPDANIPVRFSIEGPGRIIGVGNGDPTSHENDKFIETAEAVSFGRWKEMPLSEVSLNKAIQPGYNDNNWGRAFTQGSNDPGAEPPKKIFRSHFNLSNEDFMAKITWMYNSIGNGQTVYVNGQPVGENLEDGQRHFAFVLDHAILKVGKNTVAITAVPYVKIDTWDNVNTRPGLLQVLTPAPQWRRKTFSGLAQVLVQSTGEKGKIELQAMGDGLETSSLKIEAE